MSFYDSKNPEYKLNLNTEGAAGLDLITPVDIALAPGESMMVDTGIRLKLEPDECALLLPRSSWAKKEIYILNTIGLIDSDYCGDNDTIKAFVGRHPPTAKVIKTVFTSNYDEAVKQKNELGRSMYAKEFYSYMHDGKKVGFSDVDIIDPNGLFGFSIYYLPDHSRALQFVAGTHFAQLLILKHTSQAMKYVEMSIKNDRGGFGTTDKK